MVGFLGAQSKYINTRVKMTFFLLTAAKWDGCNCVGSVVFAE